jgi:ATP-dependent 26S proteasome regulatory subunit
VDQAIYFPLPDAECRRRLFAHFGKDFNLGGVGSEALVQRTEGASPAFLQELCRKAALMAAERGERSQPLSVTGSDFDQALHELIESGGELTRNLLGFRQHECGPVTS